MTFELRNVETITVINLAKNKLKNIPNYHSCEMHLDFLLQICDTKLFQLLVQPNTILLGIRPHQNGQN